VRRWVFLSLTPKPWFFSLGLHLALLFLVLYVNRTHTMDLSIVSLDMLTTQSPAASVPPPEDLWQKPMLRKIARMPLPKPKVVPTPQVGAVEGEGLVRSVAEVSQLPHFKTQVKAVYPEAAKHSGIEGVVMLQVDVDSSGNVMGVTVVQGLGFGCDEAAANAMKQSTFTPAYDATGPVPVRIKIPYRFKINE
jgi:TonB family protein